MAERFDLPLTQAQAIVLYGFLSDLDDEGKLEPQSPAFDPAVNRVLVNIHGFLESRITYLWQDDATVVERAYNELREEHRAMWDDG